MLFCKIHFTSMFLFIDIWTQLHFSFRTFYLLHYSYIIPQFILLNLIAEESNNNNQTKIIDVYLFIYIFLPSKKLVYSITKISIFSCFAWLVKWCGVFFFPHFILIWFLVNELLQINDAVFFFPSINSWFLLFVYQ